MDDQERTKIARQAVARRIQQAMPSFDDVIGVISDKATKTIYLGIDPTGELHIGHTISLLFLRDLALLGHRIIVLFGDFTARIGDPTDKNAARKTQTKEEVEKHLAPYASIIKNIIEPATFEVRRNSEWLAKLSLEDVLGLSGKLTVQQMIARDMFQKRIKAEKPIFMSEFFYPLMQGYDSVAMKVDGEVGGNDQLFNMLVGRDLVKEILGKEKIVFATKLLIDEKSGKKLGKTENTLIKLSDSPQEIRRKILAIDDESIENIFLLCTTKPLDWIRDAFDKKTKSPRDLKEELSNELINLYHGSGLVDESRAPIFVVGDTTIEQTLRSAGVIKSNSDIRRLITQKAIEINGKTIDRWDAKVQSGDEIRVGRGTFLRVK